MDLTDNEIHFYYIFLLYCSILFKLMSPWEIEDIYNPNHVIKLSFYC